MLRIFAGNAILKPDLEKGEILMNPRIFISSTFYDLKYAREDLSDFISSFGFDAIRSESGNIGYTPGVELDESCYAAMRESDMAILIIGGRYGSPTSEEKPVSDEFKKFTSVTRKEFGTAIKNNVPVFVFIEESVNTEYSFYKKNKALMEGKIINFTSVDNVNVFRFIEDIQMLSKLAIFSFRTLSDIKDTLRLQWADMFRKYLFYLRQQESAIHEIEPTISEIYSSIQEMKIMLQNVGKATFADDPQKMEIILDEQMVENAAGKIACAFEFVSSLGDEDAIHQYLQFFVRQLFEAKRRDILEYPFSDNVEDEKQFYLLFEYEGVFISAVKEHLEFEDNIFKDHDEFRNRLVDRLGERDYLKKMKII